MPAPATVIHSVSVPEEVRSLWSGELSPYVSQSIICILRGEKGEERKARGVISCGMLEESGWSTSSCTLASLSLFHSVSQSVGVVPGCQFLNIIVIY